MLGFVPKDYPTPIKIGKAHEIWQGNTEEGLKIYLCIKVKPHVYFSSRGYKHQNRGPIVLLETPLGTFLVEIDQWELPRRVKDAVLRHGILYYPDGTRIKSKERRMAK